MIVLLDTSQPLDVCAAEVGAPVEQLLTPLTRYRLQHPDRPFCIDNGGFSRFDGPAFAALLARELPRQHLCRWVAVPDVVGSARRTLEVFRRFAPTLAGWKLALVCQDGQEDLEIPWEAIDAVFIGGSTDWKTSAHAEQIVRAAKILGKWAHIGRVNTPGRFEWAESIGADSIDGTGLARYSWMREAIAQKRAQPQLFDSEAAA